jgi:hypothetical protein
MSGPTDQDAIHRRLFEVWDRVTERTISAEELRDHERMLRMFVLASEADAKFAVADYTRMRAVELGNRVLRLPAGQPTDPDLLPAEYTTEGELVPDA